jgi:hypothetical protein
MDECFGNGPIHFQWITLSQLHEMNSTGRF